MPAVSLLPWLTKLGSQKDTEDAHELLSHRESSSHPVPRWAQIRSRGLSSFSLRNSRARGFYIVLALGFVTALVVFYRFGHATSASIKDHDALSEWPWQDFTR